MTTESYKNLLNDVISELLAKKISQNLAKIDEFSKGYNFAIYEIVSLLIEQSENFNIDKHEIGLKNINPETYFLEI